MACLLFSAVKINFMPQFIPVSAVSEAFKSCLTASLCSATRLLGSLRFTCERRLPASVLNFACYSCCGTQGTASALCRGADLPGAGQGSLCLQYLLPWRETLGLSLIKHRER